MNTTGTTMKRRDRSDSVTAAVSAAIAASNPLPTPPAFVRLMPEEMVFWDAIARSRALSEWSDADLVVAAQLARCQADIERQYVALNIEGVTLINDRGTPIMNPRNSVLEQLSRRQMALMRTLQLGGTARGRKEDVGKQRGLERQARRVAEGLDDDDDEGLLR